MSEKEKILQMVADGKITVEDGEKLLKAVGEVKESKPEVSVVKAKNKKNNEKNLKGKLIIQVDSSEGDNVRINLPLKLANFAMNMIPKEQKIMMNNEGIELDEILENISEVVEDLEDDIVNIESASGDNVRIFIEK